jgi:hypothetical protein
VIARFAGEMAATAMAALDSLRRDGIADTSALEEALHGKAMGMCRETMGLLLNAEGVKVPGDSPREGEASAGTRGRDILTLFGRVRVEGRRYYHAREAGAGRLPFDDALGLVGGATPALAKRAMEHALKEPYERAAESFGRAYTRDLTPDVLKALAREAAARAEGFFAAGAGAADAPRQAVPCAVVLGDGTGMPMRPGELEGVKGRGEDGAAKTREAKVGAVFAMTPAPGDPDARARVPDSTTYVATLDRKDAFAGALRAESGRRFPAKPKVTLFICDGAKWLREIRRTHFPFAVETLDFYHATEHLAPLLDLAGLKGGGRGNMYRKWRRWLKEGKAAKVVAACEAMAAEDPAKSDAWDAALGYYRDNLGRMKYDEYIAKGWFIGSGVVESACKAIICTRFKQPGMRWGRKGADALLPFRTAHLSGRYDEIWDFIRGDRRLVSVVA